MSGHSIHCPCRCFDPSDDPTQDLRDELSTAQNVIERTVASIKSNLPDVSDDLKVTLVSILVLLENEDEPETRLTQEWLAPMRLSEL